MSINQKYHICNNVIVKYDELIKSDFDVSPVWVEQNIPSELEYIRKRQVTDDWIEQYFYDEIKDDSHPYYTIIGDNEYYKHSEFNFIGCLIHVGNSLFHGYVTVFDRYLTSLKIFHYGKTFSYYLNDLFDEENVSFKSKVASIVDEPIRSVQINLKSDFKEFKNSESNLVINHIQNV